MIVCEETEVGGGGGAMLTYKYALTWRAGSFAERGGVMSEFFSLL